MWIWSVRKGYEANWEQNRVFRYVDIYLFKSNAGKNWVWIQKDNSCAMTATQLAATHKHSLEQFRKLDAARIDMHPVYCHLFLFFLLESKWLGAQLIWQQRELSLLTNFIFSGSAVAFFGVNTYANASCSYGGMRTNNWSNSAQYAEMFAARSVDIKRHQPSTHQNFLDRRRRTRIGCVVLLRRPYAICSDWIKTRMHMHDDTQLASHGSKVGWRWLLEKLLRALLLPI